MPSFKSINGIWEAAHERVATVDKEGNPQIYNGPDRAAQEYIEQNGGDVGQDALKDPQLLQTSRNMGFTSVDEYIKHFQPTPKQVEATKQAQSKVITHTPEPKKPGVQPAGQDGGVSKGGFYDEKSNPQKEFDKKG